MAVWAKDPLKRGFPPVDLINNFSSPFCIFYVHDPYFRPGMVERNFTHYALRILIQHPGIDPGLPQSSKHDMRVRKSRSRIDLEHQQGTVFLPCGCENRSICPSERGGRNSPVSSARRCKFNPSLRQAVSNRIFSTSANSPLPRMREPKFGSFSRPPRICLTRLMTWSALSG